MDTSKLNDMNRRFDEKLKELISPKGQNTQFFTNETYAEMIEKVKSAKSKTSHKKPEDYQRLRRFDIFTVGETERLIVPAKDNIIRYFVRNDEIFQILHDTHLSLGHGGRNRMKKELKLPYKNITREMIAIYLNLCDICEKKRNNQKKALAVKPSLSDEMKSRCQVDLIDMPSQADGEYKFILVYQDHLTKFVQLRPLKTEAAEEVAYVLLDIFTIFGAPSILQSDNGREFADKIVRKACEMWPELKIVHGKTRHSQSQESVERANQDIQNMLSMWLDANNTKKWSEGLRFVQLMKNSAHHTGINCTPYEAMFGRKLKLGLKSSCIPHEVLLDIHSEEDLEKLLPTESTVSEGDLVDSTESDQVESIETDCVETEISLRDCCRMSSKRGGQDYRRCGCKGGCKSDECSCHKEKPAKRLKTEPQDLSDTYDEDSKSTLTVKTEPLDKPSSTMGSDPFEPSDLNYYPEVKEEPLDIKEFGEASLINSSEPGTSGVAVKSEADDPGSSNNVNFCEVYLPEETDVRIKQEIELPPDDL